MKNTSYFKSLLATAGLAGLLITALAPAAIAQQEDPEQKSRKVRLKIFTEVDGKQTVKDTIMEITGDLPHPDLTNLKNLKVHVSGAGDKEIEQLLYNRLPATFKTNNPAEAEKLLYRIQDGERQIIRKEDLEKRLYKLEKQEDGETKIYRKVLPEGEFRSDSAGTMKVFRFRSGDLNGSVPEFRKMDPEKEALMQQRIQEIRKLLPVPGDSMVTFNRVIIVHCDLSAPEKQLLESNARKETSSAKLKDLELEEVDLYPNPNSGIFNLSFEAARKSNTTITILDALGREVHRENLKNFKGRYQKEINLSHLSKGIYFLQVVQGKHVYNKKIMLQ